MPREPWLPPTTMAMSAAGTSMPSFSTRALTRMRSSPLENRWARAFSRVRVPGDGLDEVLPSYAYAVSLSAANTSIRACYAGGQGDGAFSAQTDDAWERRQAEACRPVTSAGSRQNPDAERRAD
jgi:hypothetical protein